MLVVEDGIGGGGSGEEMEVENEDDDDSDEDESVGFLPVNHQPALHPGLGGIPGGGMLPPWGPGAGAWGGAGHMGKWISFEARLCEWLALLFTARSLLLIGWHCLSLLRAF